MLNSRIPGIDRGSVGKESAAEFLKTSDIIFALKTEIAKATRKIEDLKESDDDSSPYYEHPLLEQYAFQEGTGSIQGQSALVHTDTGLIGAGVPFTGYAGSEIFPNIRGSRAASSCQTTRLNFNIKPFIPSHEEIEQMEEYSRVEVADSFLRDVIYTSYTQLLDVPLKANKDGFFPEIIATGIDLTICFEIEKNVNPSITGPSFIIVPAPGINRLSGTVDFDRRKTETYTLTLSLPLIEATTNDPRRIFYTEDLGGILMVEEPYREERFDQLEADLAKATKKSSVPSPSTRPITKTRPDQVIDPVTPLIDPRTDIRPFMNPSTLNRRTPNLKPKSFPKGF